MAGKTLTRADLSEAVHRQVGLSRTESADLVKRSRLIITHDTGLMHIAAAFSKPILSVWGNTVPEFGMYPYYGANQKELSLHDLYEVKRLYCRPCSKIGYRKCPLGHFKCMNKQDLPAIVRRTHERLGKLS